MGEHRALENQSNRKPANPLMKSPLIIFFALLLSTFILQPSAFPQGSLTPPPGTPAPTMKTLDQVEARIPIDTAHTPGDQTNEFIISQPGSYYLTGNLSVAKTNGISVVAVGV